MINSRYLMFEAQQAHYYGLNPALALASVTSTPARAAGMGHRVGTIAQGLLKYFILPTKALLLSQYGGITGYDAGTPSFVCH